MDDLKIVYILIITSIVIGLTTFLLGCDDKTFCNNSLYTHVQAKVIKNDCNQYKPDTDDTITYECKVKFEYGENAKKYCYLHRSDDDSCNRVRKYKDLRACDEMNRENYQLNNNYTVLFNRKTKECDSMHYARRLSTIGVGFLYIAGLLILFVAITRLTSIHHPPARPTIEHVQVQDDNELPTIANARIINTMPIQIVPLNKSESKNKEKKELELIATIV